MRTRPAPPDGISEECNQGLHYECVKCKRCDCHERPGVPRQPRPRFP